VGQCQSELTALNCIRAVCHRSRAHEVDAQTPRQWWSACGVSYLVPEGVDALLCRVSFRAHVYPLSSYGRKVPVRLRSILSEVLNRYTLLWLMAARVKEQTSTSMQIVTVQ
jgi:hypothetical protein